MEDWDSDSDLCFLFYELEIYVGPKILGSLLVALYLIEDEAVFSEIYVKF